MRYLTITYFRQPGGQIDEQVGYTKRLRQSDLQTCNVILDYKSRKVQKCVIEGKVIDRDFNALNDYYKEVYPSLIEQIEKVQATETKAEDGQ
jgi:hypothetical protein